jgi:hypothetical protein
VNRLAIAAAVVAFASIAHADSPSPPATESAAAKPTPVLAAAAKPVDSALAKQPEPDAIADVESREANLESTDRRYGYTFAFAPGAGIMFGGGVGRGPAVSIRLGHVATRKTIITFELTGSSSYHKASMDGETLSDTNYALLIGAQRYKTGVLWGRAAAGLTTLVKNASPSGTDGESPIGGFGTLVGGGVDLARWGYLVLGIETFALASVSSDGFKMQLGFNLGLSLY